MIVQKQILVNILKIAVLLKSTILLKRLDLMGGGYTLTFPKSLL